MKELMVVGNMKMYKTATEMKTYLTTLHKLIGADEKITVCVPYTSLHLCKKITNPNIVMGAENIHEEEEGKFTGEISAKMVADLGVELTLIGHSERRQYFGETNLQTNKKIKSALKNKMRVILCFGETRAQRMAGKTNEILQAQVTEGLAGIYENELKSIVLAYEPVWAIGTGEVASTKDVSDATAFVKEVIQKMFSKKAADEMKILYGGSVDPSNAKAIFGVKTVDGGLIGGAALDPQKLLGILRARN